MSRYALVASGEVHGYVLWDGVQPFAAPGYTLVPAAQAAGLPAAPNDPHPLLSVPELRAVLAMRIKIRASEIILGKKQIAQQINLLADGEDLLLKALQNLCTLLNIDPLSLLTEAEWTRLLGGRALYQQFVIPVRTRSDQLEAQLAGRTRRQLLALAARDWPDSDWPQ